MNCDYITKIIPRETCENTATKKYKGSKHNPTIFLHFCEEHVELVSNWAGTIEKIEENI